jgi:hypothetical protein
MAPPKKSKDDLQAQESDIRAALRTWYISPGIQRELRNDENEAVRIVLEVLERRLKAAKKEK